LVNESQPALVRIATLVARQGGCVHHAQLRALGLHPMEIRRLKEQQGWATVLPGVYGDGKQAGVEQDLNAALLWGGASSVISHRAAARVLGLEGVERAPTEITVPLGRRPRTKRVVVHRSELPRADRQVHSMLRLTSTARTLVDLAAVVDEDTLALAVESAWRRRLCSVEALERRVVDLGTQGRPGMKLLGSVLKDCRTRGKPLDSALEVRLWRAWPADLPRPISGFEFRDGVAQPGRIDFAFPDQLLAIECDGYETHSARRVFEADRIRLSRLAGIGWRVVHVTSQQVGDLEEVFARISRALRWEPPAGRWK
jgi:very-short-patch-repair endonuclease